MTNNDAQVKELHRIERLERLAVADLSRLDKEIEEKFVERAVVADAIMCFRFARWHIVIARAKPKPLAKKAA